MPSTCLREHQEPLLETGTDTKACQVRLPRSTRWVVSSPSLPASSPRTIFLPFCSNAFNLGAWQRGNSWGKRKSREGAHLVVIVVNLRPGFCSIALQAARLSLAGFLGCQVLGRRGSSQHRFGLQLPHSLSCPGRTRAPRPRLPSCFLAEPPDDCYAEICTTDKTLLSLAAVAREGCDI